jgi:MFS family permease
MESFAARFPRIALDSSFKGWFVSTLLLFAWAGSLANGPIADRAGRKGSILLAVVVFTVGSALQAAAHDIPMLFAGRAVAGFSVGMLTMIVPMYISEVAPSALRGTLVVLQQLSITLGILVSYWLEYATQYIGGTGTGQSEAAWRLPLAVQILPALVLGLGMLLYPESPRYLLMRQREDRALEALACIRRADVESESLCREYLAIKAEVLFDEAYARDRYPAKTGLSLCLAQYSSLLSTKASLRRLTIGCVVMFFQQFMGCNAIIYCK